MAEVRNPELEEKLLELERELEEGDITEKGFQKRRNQLFSQYLGAPPVASPPLEQQHRNSLRIHSPESSSHPSGELRIHSPDSPAHPSSSLRIHSPDSSSHAANDGHRTSALTALGGGNLSNPHSPTGSSSFSQRQGSFVSGDNAPAALLRPGGPVAERAANFQHRPDSLFIGLPQANDPSTRSETMVSTTDYAFNPEHHGAYPNHENNQYTERSNTLQDSQQYFSDFAGQQDSYENNPSDEYGPQRYPANEAFSPTAAMAPPMLTTNDLPPPEMLNYQQPLEPREVPFAIYDPHDNNLPMSKFDNIAAVLRHRGKTTAKAPAFWVLDSKGKEIGTITWDKFASRAEKVAQVIRDKSTLYRGDRVALLYRDTEIIDFAIALLGCFIAGVVAVPINDMQDYQRLNFILTSTQAHLALTTENNLKSFQREITAQRLTWPKGVEWWKTNEFGSFHPKKSDDIPPLSVPDLAYIEFSRAPTGDHRGVVLSHRTIMHQMACLSSIVTTLPGNSPRDTFNPSLRDKNGRLISGGSGGETLLSYLDPRHGIGMILGVLFTIYGGHTAVWMENRAVDVPGLYAHLITKYKATLMAADYTGLNRAVRNYQTDPMTTRNFKKGMEPNFQSVKLCLIDTLTVNCEFHELLADRWLRPLRNPRAREVVAPMLCLPEHGGMVISVRDWVGGEERLGVPLKLKMGSESGSEYSQDREKEEEKEKEKEKGTGFVSLLGGGGTATTEQHTKNEMSEVLLDREALKRNEVIVLAIGDEARKEGADDASSIRVGSFGYPIPDATLAIVDPESGLLGSPYSVGEIWVDSPSLSGGFWALPKHTEQIFHARPYRFVPGDPTPAPVEPEFLRTGLLGTIIEGKVFVLGLYEDRIRQKVEWVEHGHEVAEYRYFFVQHIILSILRGLPMISDASAFDVLVNEEHLPILVVESLAASVAPLTSGGAPRQLDRALLESLAERCMEILEQEHNIRLYCVMISPPNSLPRIVRNGRREIGNMLCRRDFDLGTLPCAHVKFGVERAVLNLPVGVDPIGGIWSQVASQTRAEFLVPADKQYSGIDRREVVIDDRTSTPLNQFSCITDLIQWRVARQPDELAYCTIDSRVREGKGVTWKKFDQKIAAVAMYLKNKVKVRAKDHIILMYTHSEDFVYALHACISLGTIVIPMAPLDQNRLSEDVPAFLRLVQDFGVKFVLVNQEVDHLLKLKPVSSHIKQSAHISRTPTPNIYNTSKISKQTSGLRDLGIVMDPAWIQPTYPVIIWTYWTPDQKRLSVQLGHDTILGMCKVQKETCQMTSSRPVLGCVRSMTGLGFIHSCLMGIYIGTPTYLLSPVEFAQQPMSLFVSLSRYKIKDTYATPQMLDHAMAMMAGKGFTLRELKNMMISAEGRPRVDVFQKVRLHFAAAGLDRTAINTVYSHVLNPMVASRSYMCIEPVELWLDTKGLRRGIVLPVDPGSSNSRALLVQDSGMVPVSTQIAIVNPESRLLCHDGEYGEIWVDSEACVKSFYGSSDPFDEERFNGRTVDGDPTIQYVRTGDLGFLHSVSRPIGPGGAQVDMQVLFVLGSIGETFEINGLNHFPMDIESSVERCHRRIVPGGCAVFQAGGLLVVIVEVPRSPHLACLVPVIVNAILNEHQIVVDIIAFVNKGNFPRSRLGEKQRGTVLAKWVKRSLQTEAQFAIRNSDFTPDPAGHPGMEGGIVGGESMHGHRASLGSLRGSTIQGAPASSLRNVESATRLADGAGAAREDNRYSMMPPASAGSGEKGYPMGERRESARELDARYSGAVEDQRDLGVGAGYGREGQRTEQQYADGRGGGSMVREHTPQGHGRLPGVDGRETSDIWRDGDGNEEDDWTADAIMHMNLAGDLGRGA
ncbi:probable acyl CoA ligase-like protein [Cephalotrichum gorgonifer]|uniref:Probable acyl CoA ligase-like protein n=1 Tax=Cephalotrichum gorgonifer TaxID=2041049 RepID=A0AAE8MXC1_9PEZI|nr:probable acyl CoA ligase-like protein [Cephalotrichum gorgonifer]